MKTIVFTAQAFGFGPVSKMLTISDNITNVRKIFFGTGVAFDLAKIHRFDEVHKLTRDDAHGIISLLKECDLFINVMDFEIQDLAKIAGCKCFIIDTLLWFWNTLPKGINDVDKYFCQDFFGLVEPKIKEYKLKNAQIVGPITDNNFRRLPEQNQVIINFAGLENPFVEIGKNSDYPFIMLENILPIIEKHFSSILVVGLQKIMEICQKRFGCTNKITYKMLHKKEMLEQLHKSEALITAPGGETMFDAYDKLPIFCLPPQNNSNFDNLNIYINNNIIQHYFSWIGLDYDHYLKCENEKEQVEMVLFNIKLFANNLHHQKIFQIQLQDFLNARNNWTNLIVQQKKVITKFGENGTQVIIKAIHETLYLQMEKHYTIFA